MLGSNAIVLSSSPDPAPETEESLRFSPGKLVEISGPDARRQAARLLAAYPGCPAAWIESSLDPFPDELRRFRLNWDKVLFVDGKKDAPWALSSFIRSGHFPFVIYYAKYGRDGELRRLRKLAKLNNTMVLLLGDDPFPAWQIHSQYRTHTGKLELVRGKKI